MAAEQPEKDAMTSWEKHSVTISRLDGGLDPDLELPTLPPPSTPGYGENDGFWVWDDTQGLGMHLWLGSAGHPILRLGRVTIWLPDGRVLTRMQDGVGVSERTQGNGMLFATVLEPYRRWRWSLLGSTQPTTADELRAAPQRDGPKVHTRVELEAEMITPPWVNGGFVPPEVYAASDFAKAQGGFRFEQFLKASGVVQIGNGPELRFEGVGSRTHRKGVRILTMAKFPGHVWAGAVFPSGRAFYVQQHAGADGPIISDECWVKSGDVFHRAEFIDPPRFRPELAGERFEIRLRSAMGLDVIQGERIAQSFQMLPVQTGGGSIWGLDHQAAPGDLAMDQGFIRYTWGGETACNFMERSLPIGVVSG
ncbi:MAG: hypothetical protein M0R03_09940 [Novosphingobium sp.]|nr:hypothetical protein [Novosphingobium sp.]